MDQVISELLRNWGAFGLIIVVLGYLIYDKFIKKSDNIIKTETGKYNKNDLIYESLKDIKESLTTNVSSINSKIDTLEVNVNEKINKLETKVDQQISYIESKVNDIPIEDLTDVIEEIETSKIDKDYKAFEDTLRLGDNIFDLLSEYTKKINCTHIFIGSFHNGSQAITGFPYMKFNIIVEAFNPDEIVEEDHEFEPVYRDCHLSLLGKLPLMLIQKKMLYFYIDENNDSDMFNYDNIIVRRMIGMGIKQIALHLTCENNKPSGFIGIVKYNYDKMDMDQFKLCVKELEIIHNNTPRELLTNK